MIQQLGPSDDIFSKEQLESIRENCLFWANNCGGCETCTQYFSNPPLYDHQETFYLTCMIYDRNYKIESLERKVKIMKRFFAIYFVLVALMLLSGCSGRYDNPITRECKILDEGILTSSVSACRITNEAGNSFCYSDGIAIPCKFYEDLK